MRVAETVNRIKYSRVEFPEEAQELHAYFKGIHGELPATQKLAVG